MPGADLFFSGTTLESCMEHRNVLFVIFRFDFILSESVQHKKRGGGSRAFPEILRVWLLLLKEALTSLPESPSVTSLWGGARASLRSVFPPILGCVELALLCASLAHFPEKTRRGPILGCDLLWIVQGALASLYCCFLSYLRKDACCCSPVGEARRLSAGRLRSWAGDLRNQLW